MGKRVNFIRADKTIINEKVKEAFSSVLPITLIVLALCFTIVPIDSGTFLSFILGAFLVIVGMGLFTLGADTAMTPIGEYVGTTVMRSKKIWIIVLVCFIVGVLITISEPDLTVLATQLEQTIDKWTLIITVGVGVGVFLVIAFLRIVLKINLSYLLIGCYAVVFTLSFFVPETFVPLAFDSGGVTTGPMSVPFIIAIGTGVASMRSDKGAENDGFGLTALCSVGPIIAVMILGIIFKPDNFAVSDNIVIPPANSKVLLDSYLVALPHYMKEVGIALLPIVAFYFIFRIFGHKTGKSELIRILIGVLYTYVGLVFFLLGVNVGFLPVGSYLGEVLGSLDYNWIVVPIGMVIGYFVVAAEPAVHVLTKQVYEITSGAIPKKALRISLMLGVAVSVGLAMLRIVLNIPIMYFLIPGYLIALFLTFFVPNIFTAIAFDSGGVASGAMTASFLLPLALGVCKASGGNVATQGFGVVAMVAMTPLIAIQILGLIYRIKTQKLKKKEKAVQTVTEEIIG
ncbi:MAG: DUF1538 domain-containing protein [Clostridiales bacterium]|nr:DUF1538 domain-containing protein [Clostridiales bacterium]